MFLRTSARALSSLLLLFLPSTLALAEPSRQVPFEKPDPKNERLPVLASVESHNATIQNVSRSLRITSLCGYFEYETPLGNVQRTRWTYNFGGPLALTGRELAPGDVHHFKPRRHFGRRDRFIEYLAFATTGVVFSDLTYAGPDGHYCASRKADTARAARLMLMEMRQILKYEREKFEKLIKLEEPMVAGHRAKAVHLFFQQLILGPHGELSPRFRDILDETIERLGEF